MRPGHPDQTKDKKCLFISSDKRVLAKDFSRWTQKESTVQYFEALAEKAGKVDRDNVYAYVYREILFTGLDLAALLDELHSDALVYSLM